jgi:hypothetical protein
MQWLPRSPTASQVRLHAALVGQGDEVVVEPAGAGAVMHLGVHAGDRAGDQPSLVGQVAAEVEQGAAGHASQPGTVIRAGSPTALLAVVSHLLGFVPDMSLVVIGTAPPRDRIRVTLRYDLPDPPDAGMAADIAAHAAGVLGAQRLPAAVAVGNVSTITQMMHGQGDALSRAFRQAKAASASPVVQAPTVIATSSDADELAKLADLRDRGVLTDEEFQAKKAQILGL